MEFKLPDIGEGVHEGELVKWLVKTGDTVKVDQPVVEVMTDKATVEIPVSVGGTVGKLHAKEGDVVKVGQLLMTIEGAGAGASAPAPKASTPAPAPKAAPPMPSRPAPMSVQVQAAPVRTAPAPVQAAAPVAQAPAAYTATPGNVLATPATRRLARDMGIDLTQIQATGPNGRVTKEDVQKFTGAMAAGPQSYARPAAALNSAASAVSTAASTVQTRAPSPLVPGQRETLIPFRGIRKKISESMVKSRFTIPDFTYVDECDISELVEFRKDAKAEAEKMGVKLTYLPFIMKAVIRALKEFPYMNAQLDEASGNIILKNYFNIGVAVDTDNGLVVPVVKDADRKSILQIAQEIQVLSEKARLGKLAMEDMKDGTFTITNAGNIGGMLATPVINWPEVGIFGVHKISRRPVVRKVNGKEEIAIGDVIWLSVAVDHRVVDGANAARFMNIVLDYLGNPKKLLLDMA